MNPEELEDLAIEEMGGESEFEEFFFGLYRFPDETAEVVAYLAALGPSKPAEVVSRIESFLLPSRYRPPWQEAMLLAVIVPEAGEVSEDFETRLVHNIGDETAEWLVRVLAVRILARRGLLTRDDLNRLWQLAPTPFRPDLVAAAAELSSSAAWASDFLKGCRGDIVLEVIERDALGAAEERELVRRATAARGTDSYKSLREGSKVFHPRWGVGRIVSITEREYPEAVIDFSGEQRNLVLPFAPVIELEEQAEQ